MPASACAIKRGNYEKYPVLELSLCVGGLIGVRSQIVERGCALHG